MMEECVLDAELFEKCSSECFSKDNRDSEGKDIDALIQNEPEKSGVMDSEEFKCLKGFLSNVRKKGECKVYYSPEILKKYGKLRDNFPPTVRELFNGLISSGFQQVKKKLDRTKQDEIYRILPEDKKEKAIYIIAASSLKTSKIIISTCNDIEDNYDPYQSQLLLIEIPVGFNNICAASDETR